MAAIGRLAASLAKVTDVQRVKNLGASRDRQAVQLQVLANIDLGTEGPADHLVASAVRLSAAHCALISAVPASGPARPLLRSVTS